MKHTKPLQSARKLAWEILSKVEGGSSLLELSLPETLQRSGLEIRDQKLAEKIIKGVLEERSHLEDHLAQCLTGKLRKLSKRVQTILRMGAYQILFLERVPHEVVVNESVKLAKQVTDRHQANLVNAVLRKLSTHQEKPKELQLDTVEQIAKSLSHPEWIIKRWIQQIGKDETIALCNQNNRQWPLYARANTLRCSPKELLEVFQNERVRAHNTEFESSCLIIEHLPMPLTELTSFQNGLFIIQDISSVLMASVLEAKPDETILDLCSAPGGKTTLLAAHMKNTGSILAVDVSPERLKKVEENCARLGVTNTKTLCCDARTLTTESLYDRILIDAPCTGLGTLGRKKDLRWNRKEEDLHKLQELQLQLLNHASTLLKPSGVIVYSTCSIDSSENEDVVDAFLLNHTDFSREPLAGLPKELCNERGEVRTWPHRHNMSGGFASVLTSRHQAQMP
ncbi:MAG: 16S rRNA (cytosine(967)-C(5))-methyltransferase RsmB [Bdellovibrionales bacterium]|nr:16S rRNA (cytosine(967)-C(5))-methyltransferase RsmB [Bdellovibrionales bacterium]